MKPKNKYPLLFAVLIALGISPSYAQVNESDGAVLKDEKQSVDNDKIFDFVEQMPEYPGGQRALLQWIGSYNKRYPKPSLAFWLYKSHCHFLRFNYFCQTITSITLKRKYV